MPNDQGLGPGGGPSAKDGAVAQTHNASSLRQVVVWAPTCRGTLDVN